MWQVGIIDNTLASSQGSDFEMQYPLSPQQRGVFKRYYSLVQASQCSIYGTWNSAHISATNQDPHNESEDHKKYQLPLGSPGSEKTQVVKCLVHYQKRDVLWANWSYMWVLATYRMGKSPLKICFVTVSPPGFHSPDLKLQIHCVLTMLSVSAKDHWHSLKRLLVTDT